MGRDDRTLLLVEDEAIIALEEQRILESFGYSVVTVYSGEAAIEAIATNPGIDLVLMDVDLGRGIDGTVAAERILAQRDLPVVFLSSHTEPEFVERTERITSYGYIVKSSGETVLRTGIKMALRLFESRQREKRKDAQLEQYFNSSMDLLCIVDTDGRFVRINPEWERALDCPASELEGRLVLDFIHEDDRVASKDALERLRNGEPVDAFENRYLFKDGSYRWIEWRAKLQDEHIHAAARDVTERKQQERALEIEIRRFEHLFQNDPTAIAVIDGDDRVVQCNNEFTRLFGMSSEEVVGRTISNQIVPEELIEEGSMLSSELLSGRKRVYRETRRTRKDGSAVDVAITATPVELGGNYFAYVIYQDITDRKRAEAALAESERRYRDLFESAPFPVWLEDLSEVKRRLDAIDATSERELWSYLRSHPEVVRELAGEVRVLDVNRSAVTLFGAESKDAMLAGLPQLFSDESYSTFCEELLAYATGKTSFRAEDTPISFRGEPLTVEIHVLMSSDIADPFSRVHVSAIDVTERRRAEQRLRESEAMFRSITENAFDAISLIDLDGTYLYCNTAEAGLVGAAPNELIGRSAYDFIHPDDLDRVFALFREMQERRKERCRGECRVRRPDGSYAWTDFRAAIMFDENDGSGRFLVHDRDITEYKEYENRITALLQEKELLLKESHHRIKNHLDVISSLFSYHAGLLPDERASAVLRDAASRARSMMSLYDKLYRAEHYEKLSIREYLGALVVETATLNDPTGAVVTDIEIEEFELSARVLAPLGIIVNELVTNTFKHGFPGSGGGRISVAAKKREGIVRFEYADNGVGLADSTGAAAETGFGRRLINILVEQIGGSVSVDSEHGTRYVLEFPG